MMDSTIQFTKMHGIGNDYIYIDCTSSAPSADFPSLSRLMSPRHTAIGSDGIILILPSEIADFKMRIFNADGSEARMCGNGSRCVGKYVYDHKLTDKTLITLETLSGVKYLTLHINEATNKVDSVTVDMGKPSFTPSEIGMNVDGENYISILTTADEYSYPLTAVSMGNPHGVIIMPEGSDVNLLNIEKVGPLFENHRIWTDRANIEFINILNPHEVTMRVWERGSGETMACGTGACASAVTAIKTGLAKTPVTVHLLGGDLTISLTDEGNVLMTGGATEVFTGVYNFANFQD